MSNRIRITFKDKPRENFEDELVVYFPEKLRSHHISLVDDTTTTRLISDIITNYGNNSVADARRKSFNAGSYDSLTKERVEEYGRDASGFF